MKMSWSLLAMFALLTAACGDESSFDAGGNKAAKEVPKPPPVVPQSGNTAPEPPLQKPETCNEHGATLAKLLTTTVKNGEQNQFVKYEISLVDCDGRPLPIKGASIAFDIDGSLFPATGDINYKIADAANGTAVASGSLGQVTGSDLFGKTGIMYSHWRTANIDLPDGHSKILLDIDISGRSFGTIGSLTPPTTDLDLPTYLRYGESAPVQQNVKFLKK